MANDQDIIELRREYNSRLETIERRQKSFFMRLSLIINGIIPGLGFVVYGKGLLKGLITFLLFCGYILFHRIVIYPITDFTVMILYLFPALVVWLVSLGMLGGLD